MNKIAPILIVLLAMLVASACTKGIKQEDVDPFVVSKAEVRDKVAVLAVAPMRIPDGLPNAGEIESRYTLMIEDKLHEGRFSVLFPYEYATIWEDVANDIGDVNDPETGERVHEKVFEITRQTLERLGLAKHVDGIIVPTVRIVEAPFAGGNAHWHGTNQSIKSRNVMKEFLAGSPDGTVGALSLFVTLFDMSGQVLYERAGGIEVLSTMAGKTFKLVPREELFKNDERVVKSVDIVLDPLID